MNKYIEANNLPTVIRLGKRNKSLRFNQIFLSKKFLKNMKKNSCLINIGRGNAIEENDLLNHLKKNKNFYAYLDVFKNEPLKSSNQFWRLPNVTITPHVAGVTAIEPSVKYMYSKYKKLKKNKNIKSDVNPSDGY